MLAHRCAPWDAARIDFSCVYALQILREAMQQTLTNTILRETLLNQKDLNMLKRKLGNDFKAASKQELERYMAKHLTKQPIPEGHYRSVQQMSVCMFLPCAP